MELCNDGHEEICYVDTFSRSRRTGCPVCQILEEKQDEIDVLKEKIIELEEKVDNPKD